MTTYTHARLLRATSFVIGLGIVAIQPIAFGQEPPLPTGREVVARHVTAIGGEAAYKAVKSMHVRGTFEMAAQNITGSLEILSSRPDKLLTRVRHLGRRARRDRLRRQGRLVDRPDVGAVGADGPATGRGDRTTRGSTACCMAPTA